MIPVQTLVKLILLLSVSFLLSCVKDSTKSAEVTTSPTVVNRLIGNTTTAADFQSRSQSILSLSYTSLDNDLASSCSISQVSNVTVTQSCSCDGAGVCMVGVTGVGVYSGAGSIAFNVVGGGKTSTTGRVNFNITAPPAGSNVAPTITSIGAKTTTEGLAVSAIPFTVGDSDSTVSCANVTVASSNTTVLPVANVVIGGSGTSCNVTVTPAANQIGSSNVTLTLTDTGTPLPAQTATTTFTLTVTSFNDPPTISTVATQYTNEDTTTSAIAFTIGDVDSTVTCGNVTAVSSTTSLVSNGNITVGGTAPNCTVTLSPNLNQSGSTNITLILTDNGSPLPAKSVSTSFALSVVAVNDAPVVSTILTQSGTENIAKAVNFTITDVDSTLNCASSVVVTSSNTTLVPNTNIAITGTAPSCVATITPASNQSGSSTLTVTVSDNGFPMPIQSSSTSFVMNFAAVNRAPTISAITTKTTNEDTTTTSIAFTIADVDSTLYCSNVAGTSNNTTLVPDANIVITGTAPNCTATIAPAANAYGSASITLTLTDNGTPLPPLTATSIFTLNVTAVNDAPSISAITSKTTLENTASSAITYTINDIDSTLSCTSSVTVSSSNTTLVPNANVAFSGTAPNCSIIVTPATGQYGSATLTLTVTDNGTPLPAATATTAFTMNVTQVNQAPTISAITSQTTSEDTASSAIAFTIADADSIVYCNDVVGTSNNTTLVPDANIVITGTAPNCNAVVTPAANGYGTANITLTLTDNGTPPPALTATSVFSLTVNAVNDAPTISAITTKTTTEGTASPAITYTINDIDSTLSCATSVTAASSNTTLIPNSNVAFSGTAPNCSIIVTPAAGQYGSATITLTLTDGGTPLPAATATSAFTMNVTQVNQAPTISAITNQTTNEDTATSAIAFTIADSDSTVFCSNVTGVSSNTGLVANANIVITGTAPNCVATITPVANASGTSNITLTLTDNGTPAPALTANSVFTLTVAAVNDAPTISAITAQTTDEDTATSAIAFTVNDIDSTLTCAGSVAGTSSNTTVVPNANIVITGTAPNCNAVITPAANLNGSATITLTLTDNGTPMPALTATSSFTLTVAAVPDLTGTLTIASNLSGVASSYSANVYGRKMNFTGLTVDEALTTFEICLGTAAGSCDVATWVEAVGYTTSGSAPTVTLGGTYTLKSGTGGAQTFTLTPSCGTTTNYYYSVRATNSSSRISNVLSTPAWSFWEPTCLGAGTLSQWLDASEPSTITIVTGVSNWTDKSGNARTVTQATTGKQPAYSLSALGTGYPGLTFNGSTSSLMRAAFVYAQGSSSVFSVIKAAAASSKYVFSEARSVTTNNYYCPLVSSTTSTITGQVASDTGTVVLSLPTTSTTFFNGTVRLAMSEDTGSTFYTYSNGTAQSQAATSYVRGTNTINLYRLGSKLIKNVESAWFAGSIGEFIVTNGTLTTTQRQKLEGYSAHKWGVSANLPGAHPYLSAPP